MGLLAWLVPVAFSAELSSEQLEFFETKVRPILVEHCYKCHSAEAGKSKGSLTLDTRDAVRAGGATGPALVPGDPDKSLLIEAVRYASEDLQMPPVDEGGRLPAEKIAALEQWVRMGAPDPRTGDAVPAALDIASARRHWAFQPVVQPAVPTLKRSREPVSPVDAFVGAKLEAKGLVPAAPADARTLLRRLSYGLIGLPPTPGEMEAFVRDSARDARSAYAAAVERLLASPHYGERWGRFWLDVARYADTKGYLAGNVERRYPFSHTYRDYVIRAFNEDRPYDQFIVEQLAADRLPLGEDKSALAALGFLTLGRRFLNNQNDIIDDRIDVVTRGLMGLTVSCARCHDHKFEPIPTADYYALHGVFASSEEPAEKPLLGPLVTSPEYEAFLRKRAELEGRIKAREAEEVNKFLTGVRDRTGDYLLAAHEAASLPAGEKFEVFAGVRKLNVEVLKRWQPFLAERARGNDPVLAPWFALAALPREEFAAQAAGLVARWKLEPAGLNSLALAALAGGDAPIASLPEAAARYNRVFADVEKAWQAAMAAAQKPDEGAGSPALPAALENPEQEAVRQLLYAAGAPANVAYEEAATMLKRQIDTRVAGLRREIEALNWTEPGAPLRAMALVDRAKPKNSRILIRGSAGNPGPEVPRQFLAILSPGKPIPLTDGSGRLDLAREIASPGNPLTARVLANRVWGWHFGTPLVRTASDFGVRTETPVHRELLDWLAASFIESGWSIKQLHRSIVLSETYRQSAEPAASAVAVDPDNHLLHHFPRRRLEFEALRDTLLAVTGALDPRSGGLPEDLTTEPFSTRRTVYGYIDRQNLPGMFRTFDYPNPDVSSAGRFATTVPQQALFMMNSPFVQAQARRLLQRPGVKDVPAGPERVDALYRVLYQRTPDKEERRLALAFVRRPGASLGAAPAFSSGWQYGYGWYDAEAGRVRDFQAMTVRKDGRISPSAKYPDPEFGHLSVTATGGHAGRNDRQASIRRWTAPGRGSVTLSGTLAHGSPGGDGVRGRVVSSETGSCGEWTVHNRKQETRLEREVQGGETLDFVVDCLANANADGYTWASVILFTPDPEAVEMVARSWSAAKDFDPAVKPTPPLNRWEELAQVLLLANELAFVD